MGLAGARPANEHHVLRRVHKLQRRKLVDLALVKILGRLQGEVKPGQIAMDRKPGNLHLVADGAHGPVGVLGLQQVLDQPLGGRNLRIPLDRQIRPGVDHTK